MHNPKSLSSGIVSASSCPPFYRPSLFVRQGIDINNTIKKASNRLIVIKAIMKTSHIADYSGGFTVKFITGDRYDICSS